MPHFTSAARLVMKIVISLMILGAGLFVLLFGNYDEGTKKWAIGAVGLVTGFWLKG